MSIEQKNLDDKTYAELVEEARTALPAIHRDWTDHNPSDPGIALIELFAWLSEMLIYRTGRIPERSERAFLRILSGGVHGAPEDDLEAATEATLRALRERYRAVTPDDYEHLTAEVWPASPEAAALEAQAPASSRIVRARCVPERDLTAPTKTAPAPGHASLIVLPGGSHDSPWIAPPATLLRAVADFLRDRQLITTRLHVVGPTPVAIALTATLHLRDDAVRAGAGARSDTGVGVREAVARAALAHWHPWTGGSSGRGWPFGRDVDLSDVYALLDDVPGVEFVDAVILEAPPDALGDRTVKDEDGQILGVRLEAHELPRIDPITLTLMERRGGKWMPIA